MKLKAIISGFLIVSSGIVCPGQKPQGFFLEGWEQRTITSPAYTNAVQTTDPVTVSFTVDFKDTITKVSPYLFGDNANLWTGPMSNNATLMKNIANRQVGVLRGPGGSSSDVYFWNAMINTPLDSVPATLPGSTKTDWAWYGKRPVGWDDWTMDVDSFYNVLGHIDATAIITVNYGYARYGTSKYPVRKAAHMAAEWVRYDNGRTKFWEIGNEVFGSWEAGYEIDQSQNRDGQPRYISPALYGQHCRVFIDSMRAAAAENGHQIKIGVVMVEGYLSSFPTWNKTVAAQVGDKADFYSVHSYYTPYNENSTIETILGSYTKTGTYKTYVWDELDKAGQPHLPIALTEYNIFAVGSKQPVSHINGMQGVLVIGEAIKTGFGAACRWDLANGYDNGNDHGLFAYNEDGVPNYTPHAPFYHLYYLRRFTGDVLLNSTQVGASGVIIIPSAFSSGQVGAALVNTSRSARTARVNIKNFRFGDRYYTYTLTGGTVEDFSRKVSVNGATTSLVAGGPDNYESLNAVSSLIGDEIRIRLPALSVVYLLVEPGTKELEIKDDVTSVNNNIFNDVIDIFPNPAHNSFTVTNIPQGYSELEIQDMQGRVVCRQKGTLFNSSEIFHVNLVPGVYFVSLSDGNSHAVKKLIIR